MSQLATDWIDLGLERVSGKALNRSHIVRENINFPKLKNGAIKDRDDDCENIDQFYTFQEIELIMRKHRDPDDAK